MSSMDGAKDQSIQDVKQPNSVSNKAAVTKSRVSDSPHALIAPYYQRPRIHPNFDPNQTPLHPDRPLSDIPSPVRREQAKLNRIYNDFDSNGTDTNDISTNKLDIKNISTNNLSTSNINTIKNEDKETAKSAQELLVTPSFAAHLELLQAGNLIKLPASFTQAPTNAQTYPLLTPLIPLNLLDMGDIFAVLQQVRQEGYTLTRYGIKHGIKNSNRTNNNSGAVARPKVASVKKFSNNTKHTKDDIAANHLSVDNNQPEMINDIFAPEWELILYPEHFDNGIDSIETDTLACSVAVHILKQCQTRKTVNKSLNAKQICQHMRSYILSQCRINPSRCERYRQIRLFEGHVIVAAKYLGFKTHFVQVDNDDGNEKNSNSNSNNNNSNSNLVDDTDGYTVYLNVSSRNSLFVRYPNITDYFINGWT